MCVVLGLDAAGITHHTDTIRPCHASDNALKPTNPSLTANHSKCQTDSRMRTMPSSPAFVLPTYVLAEQGPHGALHRISVRISVSVLFRFYISFFVSVYIVSVRQRTLTNADDR